MAIIFDRANRIIEVEADAVKISVQELLNAIRDFEDDQANMDIPHIAEATGKADLGGGLQVGVTLKLLAWKLKFEARPGPETILCDVSGGNLVAVDESGVAVNPIEPAAYVTVTKTSSVAAALIAEWTQEEKDKLPLVIWSHSGRKLTSRDIVSGMPSEHLSSEAQVITHDQEVHDLLDAIKGAGFDTDTESLIRIREMVDELESGLKPSPKASFNI